MKHLKKKIFLIIFVFAIIITVCFFFLLLPSALAVKNNLSQLNTQQNFFEEIDKRGGNLKNLKGDWGKSGENLKKIDERLVEENEIIDMVIILESLEDRLSVDQEISVVRQSEASGEILLKNSLIGNFGNIMKYIKGAENLKYLIEIDSCNFSKQSENIKADLVLKIPTYKK